MKSDTILIDSFMTLTVGIIVFFAGVWLTRKNHFLRDFNIPEPVTGGIIASVFTLAFYLYTKRTIEFEMETRDTLLIYFFTCIGLNARLSDLLKGGRPLLILLSLTLSYIVVQDVIGIAGAMLTGQPKEIGILTGSAALIGGHATAISWGDELAKNGIENAKEIGVAAATLGLICASLLGGPISKRLLAKYNLSGDLKKKRLIGIARDKQDTEQITHINLMGVILVMHVAIITGYFLDQGIASFGLKLPLFVSCLLVAIVFSNTIPHLMPNVPWPARTKALAVVSEFSLGLAISMSLMGMQLWSIAGMAGPLFIMLGLQVIAAILFIRFLLFPLMGKDYLAAVLSAGFAGFALGATPTAIANMTAVTKTHGPAPTAFIILPLVGAFFVDIVNAFVIQFFLGL